MCVLQRRFVARHIHGRMVERYDPPAFLRRKRNKTAGMEKYAALLIPENILIEVFKGWHIFRQVVSDGKV
jgi:hypothetical protein